VLRVWCCCLLLLAVAGTWPTHIAVAHAHAQYTDGRTPHEGNELVGRTPWLRWVLLETPLGHAVGRRNFLPGLKSGVDKAVGGWAHRPSRHIVVVVAVTSCQVATAEVPRSESRVACVAVPGRERGAGVLHPIPIGSRLGAYIGKAVAGCIIQVCTTRIDWDWACRGCSCRGLGCEQGCQGGVAVLQCLGEGEANGGGGGI
jgi:hypothetical protein